MEALECSSKSGARLKRPLFSGAIACTKLSFFVLAMYLTEPNPRYKVQLDDKNHGGEY